MDEDKSQPTAAVRAICSECYTYLCFTDGEHNEKSSQLLYTPVLYDEYAP